MIKCLSMGKTWQLQDAKNRLSEVCDKAFSEGPQTITRRGEPAVVVVSVKEYHRLTTPATSLLEFFQQSPLKGIDLDIERDRDPGREAELELPA